MNRASHTWTNAPNHKAMLSARIHVKDQTIPIPARGIQHGLIISHALPTQAQPSMTGPVIMKDLDKMLETLDEVITELDRINNELQTLLTEVEIPDEQG